jgi:hypothetical protein
VWAVAVSLPHAFARDLPEGSAVRSVEEASGLSLHTYIVDFAQKHC